MKGSFTSNKLLPQAWKYRHTNGEEFAKQIKLPLISKNYSTKFFLGGESLICPKLWCSWNFVAIPDKMYYVLAWRETEGTLNKWGW